MKISEAILYAVQKAGGKVEYHQISDWINYLVKNGYFELTCDGEGAGIKIYLQLTEKGEALVKKIPLKE